MAYRKTNRKPQAGEEAMKAISTLKDLSRQIEILIETNSELESRIGALEAELRIREDEIEDFIDIIETKDQIIRDLREQTNQIPILKTQLATERLASQISERCKA